MRLNLLPRHVIRLLCVMVIVLPAIGGMVARSTAVAERANGANGDDPHAWVAEIEEIFIRSENCKQCHDRHYEEWKGMREQTPDLKTFGRVDAALLHGTSLEAPIFRTVMGLWMQTQPTKAQQQQCLSCHAPAVMAFPQHVDKISRQILDGRVSVEGIGCTSCHLIHDVAETAAPPPTFKLKPGKVLFGPFAEPEENLVHPSGHVDLYNSANYCTACHFDKVKDVTRRDIPGEILKGTVCQDCHMEQSTGSATSRRGALTRGIGRHWFRGVVIPGIMLKNRNLQAEWMPRVDLEVSREGGAVAGTVLVRVGSLPHLFPDGDPVLKQFTVTVMVKDAAGRLLAQAVQRYGRSYAELLRGPIPEPFIKGGTTRRAPFRLAVPAGREPAAVEALLTYALIPTPSPALRAQYLATLTTEDARAEAARLIEEYAQERVLTFRSQTL